MTTWATTDLKLVRGLDNKRRKLIDATKRQWDSDRTTIVMQCDGESLDDVQYIYVESWYECPNMF